MFPLRPYQLEAFEKLREKFRQGAKRLLLVSPTGCLAGDTIIGVNRASKGYRCKLSELVYRFNGAGSYLPNGTRRKKPAFKKGIETKVQYSDSKNVRLGELAAAYESGVKKTFILKTNGGKSIRATADHLFETPKGWIKLGALQVGDLVRVVLKRGGKTKKKKNHYRVVGGLKNHPFHGRKGVKKGKGGFSVTLHRLVAEAELNNLEIKEFIKIIKAGDIRGLKFLDPKKWHVHHKDENHLNNFPSNLDVMTVNEHFSHHGENDGWRNVNFSVGWDEVKSIEYYGEEETFDLSMKDEPHNFIANGFVVHNSGKTVSSTHMIDSAISKGREVLFIAHRREILFQTEKKLSEAGIDHGWIMAGRKKSMMAPVHLASIQTLLKRDFPNVGLVIWDEAHHCVSRTYRKVMEHYKDIPQVGLTATPSRSDGNGLGGIFDGMVQAAYPSQLVRDGFLVPSRIYAPSAPDLRGVKVKRGDYDEAETAEKMDKPKLVGNIVEHWEKLANGRKTIVFAVTRAHAQHLTDEFNNCGHNALYVDGETEHYQRKEIFNQFETQKNGVLVNVGIATEGYDNPKISCIVLARPTKSIGLYLQMAGRGLRPAEGKTDLMILDHSGASLEHGYPDEDINWTLDETKPAGHRKKNSEPKEAQPWVCGLCFSLNPVSKSLYCQSCGQKAVKAGHSPVVKDADLRELDRKQKKPKASTQDKAKAWLECVFKASNSGLKIGAAFHMYKKRFGVNPHSQFDYIPKGKEEWNLPASQFVDRWKKGKARATRPIVWGDV